MITKLSVTSVSTKTDPQCVNMLQSYNLTDSHCNIVSLVDIVLFQVQENLAGSIRGNISCGRNMDICSKKLHLLNLYSMAVMEKTMAYSKNIDLLKYFGEKLIYAIITNTKDPVATPAIHLASVNEGVIPNKIEKLGRSGGR